MAKWEAVGAQVPPTQTLSLSSNNIDMNKIVVFCGASDGYADIYRETAWDVGALLARRGIEVIFGGGKVGIMGAVADGALQHGGRVTGVIPTFLQTKEIAHDGVTEMIVVNTMHERKQTMSRLADGVIALPGGWGTMEELFEMLTWAQLGLHTRPIGVLNVNGYYEPLKALCALMVQDGFLSETTASILMIADSIEELLDLMANYTPPAAPQWLTDTTT